MSSDRTLLEKAAKAAGYVVTGLVDKAVVQPGHFAGGLVIGNDRGGESLWNPLTDDGDALRLAVRMRFHVNIFSADSAEGIDSPGFVEIWHNDSDPLHVEYVNGSDYEAATRRAITRAAAAIWESRNGQA